MEITQTPEISYTERFAACGTKTELDTAYAEMTGMVDGNGWRKFDAYYISQSYTRNLKRISSEA